jgi:hypothetical protein
MLIVKTVYPVRNVITLITDVHYARYAITVWNLMSVVAARPVKAVLVVTLATLQRDVQAVMCVIRANFVSDVLVVSLVMIVIHVSWVTRRI